MIINVLYMRHIFACDFTFFIPVSSLCKVIHTSCSRVFWVCFYFVRPTSEPRHRCLLFLLPSLLWFIISTGYSQFLKSYFPSGCAVQKVDMYAICNIADSWSHIIHSNRSCYLLPLFPDLTEKKMYTCRFISHFFIF